MFSLTVKTYLIFEKQYGFKLFIVGHRFGGRGLRRGTCPLSITPKIFP